MDATVSNVSSVHHVAFRKMTSPNQVSEKKKTAAANLRVYKQRVREKLEVRMAIRTKNLAEQEAQYQNELLKFKSSGQHEQGLPPQDQEGPRDSSPQCPPSPTGSRANRTGVPATSRSLSGRSQASTTKGSNASRTGIKRTCASTNSAISKRSCSDGTSVSPHRSRSDPGALTLPASSAKTQL